MRPRLLVALALALCAPPLFAGFDDEPIDIRAVCKSVDKLDFPSKDRPSAEIAKTLKDCSADDSYYGIGEPVNPVVARHCAFLELEEDEDLVFGGTTILMMIYANGQGVPRNLDLAIKLACKTGGAPAETLYRIQHLQKMKKNAGPKPFDFCDDITGGFMSGHCAAHQESLDAVKRNERFEAVIAKWKPEEKKAFAVLEKTAARFIALHSREEVDLSGTARGQFIVEEEAKGRDEFLAALQRSEQGKFPKHTRPEYKAADAKLNAVYQKIQSSKDLSHGTVTPEQIREVQRIWLRYREAWVKFGKKKYPQVSPVSWRTWLTRLRTETLEAFAKTNP